MNPDDLVCISRQGLELGRLPVRETNELLRAGFLLPTDEYCTDASPERRPVSELATLPPASRPGWLKRTHTTMITRTGVMIEHAGQLTDKVSRTLRGRRPVMSTIATARVLGDYVLSLRELVAAQLKKTSQTTKAALADEVFLRKLFGAVYDCLPRPVCRFVSEQAFIDHCFKHRRKLLPEPPKE